MEKKYENEFYPVWMDIAKKEIGQKEIKGKEHNPRIVEYHKSTSLPESMHTDEVAYCSSFVNFIMDQVNLKKTNSPLARSWLKWGAELDEPRYGCVVIFKRGLSWQGHVGLFVGETASGYKILGANQNDEVNISVYDKKDLLGFRWPLDYDPTKYFKKDDRKTLSSVEKEFLIHLINLYCVYKDKENIDSKKLIAKIKEI